MHIEVHYFLSKGHIERQLPLKGLVIYVMVFPKFSRQSLFFNA